MLREISIKNFAIIDELTLSLGKGLNIITGETGAGKSIILDALSLVLGDRSSADLVRSSADEAHLEAIFELDPVPLSFAEKLASLGYSPGPELLIRRTVSRSGRGRVHLNGNLATLSILSDLADDLAEIYGQGEHQLLLRPEYHLSFVDDYGPLSARRAEFADLYREFQHTLEQVEHLRSRGRESLQHRDLLSFQLREIDSAGLGELEEEELNSLRSRLHNSEKIFSLAGSAVADLDSDSGSVSERLARAGTSLRELASLDRELRDISERLESARAEVQDLSRTLERYLDATEFSPSRLDEVESRLAAIQLLKRKYGGSIPEILAYRNRIAEELETMESLSGSLPKLEEELTRRRKSLAAAARALSRDRREAGGTLAGRVISELKDLGIPGGRFDCKWETAEEEPVHPTGFEYMSSRGIDRVEFLLSTNPGEEVKPLKRVASGGELSRIMLALKKIRSRRESASPVVVFDEIDAGIGGAVAEMVGKKLSEVSREAQVICVTHLPQIASFADQHYLVSKTTSRGKPRTRVQPLSEPERLKEISRMLAGMQITRRGEEYARELLSRKTATK